MVRPDLGLVTLEGRQAHLEAALEQVVVDRVDGVEIALVADQVDDLRVLVAALVLGLLRGLCGPLDLPEALVNVQLELLDGAHQQLLLIRRSAGALQARDQLGLALVLGPLLGARRHPKQGADVRAAQGLLGLERDDRAVRALGDDAVLVTDEVHREHRVVELLANEILTRGRVQRHRLLRDDLPPRPEQLAPDRVVLLAPIEGGARQVDLRRGRGLGPPGRDVGGPVLELAQELGDILGQILEALVVARAQLLLGLLGHGELARPPAVLVGLEEFVAQQRVEGLGLRAAIDRGLEHLEHPRLVPNLQVRPRDPAEFRDLSLAPLGIEVAGRDDRDQRRGLLEALNELLAEEVVAAEFGIAPDLGVLSQQLAQAHGQRLVKYGDPPRRIWHDRSVVDVRIADEDMVWIACGHGCIHSRRSPTHSGLHAVQQLSRMGIHESERYYPIS